MFFTTYNFDQQLIHENVKIALSIQVKFVNFANFINVVNEYLIREVIC